jgi:hypothetical protein
LKENGLFQLVVSTKIRTIPIIPMLIIAREKKIPTKAIMPAIKNQLFRKDLLEWMFLSDKFMKRLQ